MTTTFRSCRPRSQRGTVARGFLVACALVSGLAAAVGLQLAGHQLQSRFASLLGIAPGAHIAMPCPTGTARTAPATHAAKARTVAASHGVDVMPAI